MTIEPFLLKVTALITRATSSGPELLLFQHPSAGIQLPAGTVEEGEPLEQAAMREAAEETGLTGLRLVQEIGWRDELPPGATHVILHTTTVFSRPDPTSFDWARLRRGIAVRMLRQAGDYAQVTYEEGDRYPDPVYINYQITGWVPLNSLAAANRRHFFHLSFQGSTPPTWEQNTDNHIFRLFWAPLDHLPEIVAPQAEGLQYVLDTLGYRF